MSLDRSKLNKLRELANGSCQAQCPACAETGNDRKGEHLRISPEGKFGCCVFPGDTKHRKRIFALAGNHSPTEIRVRVAAAATATIQTGILGRLGKPVQPENRSDGSDGAKEVKSEKCRVQNQIEQSQTGRTEEPTSNRTDLEIRTARTGQMELIATHAEQSRTGRTGYSLLTRIENSSVHICKLIEFDTPVRSVRENRLPYLTATGDLVIPFDSPERYHWWKGGQLPHRTKQELLERKENDASPF